MSARSRLATPAAGGIAAVAAVAAAGWAAGRLSTRRERRTLQWDARHDDLTGLLNRAGLQHAVADLSAAGDPAVVLLIDLDRFKDVNDRYGHAAGDALLVAVARRLRTLHGAVGARLAGDEFAGLVQLGPVPRHQQSTGRRRPQAPRRRRAGAGRPPAASGAAAPHEIRAAVGRLLALPHQLHLAGTPPTVLRVEASIGLAVTDRLTPDLGQLLTVADAAMYAAKRRGDGCAPSSVGAGRAGPGADAAPTREGTVGPVGSAGTAGCRQLAHQRHRRPAPAGRSA